LEAWKEAVGQRVLLDHAMGFHDVWIKIHDPVHGLPAA